MWIRLLLLVTIAVGVNWAISEQIKKQHKKSSTQVVATKKMNADTIIALHRKELLYKRS